MAASAARLCAPDASDAPAAPPPLPGPTARRSAPRRRRALAAPTSSRAARALRCGAPAGRGRFGESTSAPRASPHQRRPEERRRRRRWRRRRRSQRRRIRATALAVMAAVVAPRQRRRRRRARGRGARGGGDGVSKPSIWYTEASELARPPKRDPSSGYATRRHRVETAALSAFQSVRVLARSARVSSGTRATARAQLARAAQRRAPDRTPTRT